MVVERARRRFSLPEYERLIETGFFGADERLELVDGEIVAMNPIGVRHAACVTRLNAQLGRRLAARAIVSVQNPLAIDDLHEFQPDIAVLHPRADYYAGSRPTAADTMLVVEVADTTVTYDRSVKVPRYAAAGVAEVWVADLRRDVIMVCTRRLRLRVTRCHDQLGAAIRTCPRRFQISPWTSKRFSAGSSQTLPQSCATPVDSPCTCEAAGSSVVDLVGRR